MKFQGKKPSNPVASAAQAVQTMVMKAAGPSSPFKEGMAFIKVGTDQKGSWLKLLKDGKAVEADAFKRNEEPNGTWKVTDQGILQFEIAGYVHHIEPKKQHGGYFGMIHHEQKEYGWVLLVPLGD